MDWRQRVEQKMAEKGFSNRTDLCHYAGISAGSMNLAMRGNHDLKLATLEKVAEALGTTSQWLLFGDERQIPERAPVCKTPDDVFRFTQMTINDKKLMSASDYQFVQLADTLKTSEKRFAWRICQHDMAPVFTIGSCLIIEECEPFKAWLANEAYAMGAWLNEPGNIDAGFRDVFIRQQVRAADQIYWKSTDPAIPLIPWAEHKDELHYIGLVVQWIHTPKY